MTRQFHGASKQKNKSTISKLKGIVSMFLNESNDHYIKKNPAEKQKENVNKTTMLIIKTLLLLIYLCF